MKQIKKRWLGLVIAPALLALIGFASPANATNYNSCASVPATVFGDADITDTACVFANDVSATGRITVTATSIIATNLTASFDIQLQAVNNLKTGLVTAGQNISLTSSSGNVDTTDLTADQGTLKVKADGKITIVGITKTNKYDIDLDAKNIVKTNAISSGSQIRVNSANENINITSTVDSNIDDTSGGNILLTANKSIITRSINTHSNTKPGSVRIVANKGGANTLFIIGTTATTNGVKGTITTNTVTGGGTNPTGFTFGISIQNGGTDTSAGGITVTAMGNLKVAASNSKAGTIILDAKNGILTLPTGTMNANAASGKQAGSIVLLAKTVTTASGTILSATQTAAAPGSGHSISIAAETLNLAGPTGLKIQTNGKGVTGFPALASLTPQGSVTVYSDDSSVFFLSWQLSNFASTTTAKPLTVAGAAPLAMISDGDESQVLASGFPLTFSNTDITLQSRGKTNHKVDVVYQGTENSSTNLIFNNSGTVTLDANGLGGAGGKVSVYGDRIALNAPTFNITANGPSSGNGNGGEVYFRGNLTTLNPASKVSFKADAATVGTGNAIVGDITNSSVPKAITFFPGSVSVDIGTGVGQYSFSANGGMAGGNAGTIQISSLPVRILTADAITASALAAAGNGDGGEIFFYSRIASFDPVATMSAIGKGTGQGGKFTANHQIQDLDILQFVKVDGGTTVPTTKLNGSIRLNGIWCRQWKLTGAQSWPKTHWVCTDQSADPLVPAALSLDTAASDVAKSVAFDNLRARLANENNKPEIFVFAGSPGFNSFWFETLPSNAGGLTFKSSLGSTRIYVNPWQSGSKGDPNNTQPFVYNEVREVAAHELGHATDRSFAGAGTLPSRDALYTTYIQRDTNTLDYADPAFTVRRLPCTLTPNPAGGNFPGQIPFAGVVDTITGQNICVAGQLNNALVIGGWPPNTFNSQVLTTRESSLWVPAPERPAWVEVHAQLFGYGAVGNQGGKPLSNKVFDNGYFPCLKAWATSERANVLPVAACTVNPLP